MPTNPTPITALPAAPDRSDRATFSSRATAMFDALKNLFVSEANALASTTYSNANEAVTAASSALSSANAAATSASNASTSAGNAATSASSAASLVEKYLGARATDPTQDNSGNALTAGDWYINTSTGLLRVYTGSAWTQGISALAGVSSLNGSTGDLTGFVTLTDSQTLSAKTITGLKETKTAIADSAIDIATGNYFTKTISTTTTFTVSNVPASGTTASFILELTNGGSATVNWWSGVKWAGGTAPTLTAAGVDILGFYSHDGGTTWRGLVLAKDSK